MEISVSDILEARGGLRIKQDVALKLDELKLLTPVSVDLKLLGNKTGGITVTGALQVQAEMSCSRCAKLYAQTIAVDIDELFLPKDSQELAELIGQKESAADKLCVFAYEDRLELDEVLRQNILASLPFFPLCKEDCRGVCSGCGADLNLEACTCSHEKEIDPRWEVLKKFMKDDASEK
ncbi:DUF177 domain-containing protein [bacterium]|nr:DUF177 domain-containing protein [bacterium]